ncbi:MAG: hypothetical protein ACQEXC_15225 [Pseudomonadota bacterium]
MHFNLTFSTLGQALKRNKIMLMKNVVAGILMVAPLYVNADVSARDVYGVSLGMTIDEAKEVLAERMPEAEILDRLQAEVIFEEDYERVEVISAHTDGFPITRISRKAKYFVGDRSVGDPIDLKATLEAYQKKYGEPDDSYTRSLGSTSMHVMNYADLNESAPEGLRLDPRSFSSLYSGGSFNPEEVDGIDTFLSIKLFEDHDKKGYVSSMDVELSDVATQRAFVYDAIEQQKQAQEEAEQKLRDSATTPDI